MQKPVQELVQGDEQSVKSDKQRLPRHALSETSNEGQKAYNIALLRVICVGQ